MSSCWEKYANYQNEKRGTYKKRFTMTYGKQKSSPEKRFAAGGGGSIKGKKHIGEIFHDSSEQKKASSLKETHGRKRDSHCGVS